jgi:5-methylcytosine-specific restriction endonuclease McrA
MMEGLDATIAISKKRFPSKWVGDKRVCSKCESAKPLNEYKVWKEKKRLIRISSKCRVCVRAWQRENKKLTKEERERASVLRENKRKERKVTQKERKRERERKRVAKKRQVGWSKAISLCFCVDCGKYKVLKWSGVSTWRCSSCHQKAFRVRLNNGICKVCGTDYSHLPNTGLQGVCSIKCKDKRRRDTSRACREKRDALKRGAKVAGRVIKKKVFNRDKYRCNNCGIKVQDRTPLLDDSAELDHVVPLSKGGPHTYSNVQTLCRKCNQEKSNRYVGQLVLMV